MEPVSTWSSYRRKTSKNIFRRVVLTRCDAASGGAQSANSNPGFLGRSKIADVQESQARFDAVLADEVSAVSTLAIRQVQYQEITGVAAEALALLKSHLEPAALEPDSLQAWQTRGNAALILDPARHKPMPSRGCST